MHNVLPEHIDNYALPRRKNERVGQKANIQPPERQRLGAAGARRYADHAANVYEYIMYDICVYFDFDFDFDVYYIELYIRYLCVLISLHQLISTTCITSLIIRTPPSTHITCWGKK